tara:strand:+ start:1238 stop:1633 length:396 start_codon:yes stop_codon:yes gene_type:complete
LPSGSVSTFILADSVFTPDEDEDKEGRDWRKEREELFFFTVSKSLEFVRDVAVAFCGFVVSSASPITVSEEEEFTTEVSPPFAVVGAVVECAVAVASALADDAGGSTFTVLSVEKFTSASLAILSGKGGKK